MENTRQPDTYTVYYEDSNTPAVEQMFNQLNTEPTDYFHSLFDNDSTGGSYLQFTVFASSNENAYVVVHNALRLGVIESYKVG